MINDNSGVQGIQNWHGLPPHIIERITEVTARKEENDHRFHANPWLLSVRKMASLCRRWSGIVFNCKRLFQDSGRPWKSENVGQRGVSLEFPDSTIQFDIDSDSENAKMQARSLVKEGFLRYAKCLSIDNFADIGDLQSGFKLLIHFSSSERQI